MDYTPRIYYFNICSEFNPTLLESFTTLLNRINPEDLVEINLDSNGGESAAMFAILRIINNAPERFAIIATGDADSSAMQLLLMATCKKVFLSSFGGGTLHNISIETNTNAIVDKTDECTRRVRNSIKLMNKQANDYFKEIKLSDTKIKLVVKGQDVEITKTEIIKACQYREAHHIKFKI